MHVPNPWEFLWRLPSDSVFTAVGESFDPGTDLLPLGQVLDRYLV